MRLIGVAVVLGLSLFLAPLVGASQSQTGRIYQIGVIATSGAISNVAGPNPRSQTTAAFLQGLRDLGYVYGKDFVTVPRLIEGSSERSSAIAIVLERLY